MKFPTEIKDVSLVEPRENYIIPPFGFVEIEEGNGGYGDFYGLYWELGKENTDPIVSEFNHEEALLTPVFPNLSEFIKWYNETDGQEAPRVNQNDKSFFMNLFLKAKISVKNGRTEEAIQRLEDSVYLFGEYSDSWTLLAEQYYNVGHVAQAEESGLKSILSNWMFGLPSKKALQLFDKIDENGHLKDNPLVKLRNGLFKAGNFTKPFVVNYPLLREAVQALEELGDYKNALLLSQNYAYLLCTESEEIQEENGLDIYAWIEEFKKKLEKHFPERLK
ncbi:MAG: hypothetical protein ACO1OQ_14610 [Rufibacter sp.]